MNTIIIYGSCYGTTEVYAKALAERMGLKSVPYNRIGDLSGYQRIIYLGGLYAGGVKGLAKTVKKINPSVCGRFVVITVVRGVERRADHWRSVQDVCPQRKWKKISGKNID